MKYKPGDKVRIKTWESMEKEYGIKPSAYPMKVMIACPSGFFLEREIELNKVSSNRILTIEHLSPSNGLYFMKGMKNTGYYGGWANEMIECLVKNYKDSVPIKSRFEILDL